LYYADRVNQLPLGVLGIAISTALLPVLSNQIKNNEKKEANKSISSAIKFGIIFSVPAFVGLFILSDEIIRFLFYRGAFELSDVGLTSSALVALCCGLPAFVMIKILVVPFFANEDTKTPIKVSIFCMVINLILNLILIKEFFHVGLAISTSVSAWINAIILGCILKKELKFSFNKSIFAVLIKVIISSLLMGCAILGLIDMSIMNFTEHSFFDKNLTLITCITFGMAIYFVSIYVLGVKELKMGKWKKKKKTTN
jgi:putative peptidoglycan lipid II flippase